MVCPDGGTSCAEAVKIVTFEVIDEAKVQCKAVPSAKGPSEIPATCAPEALEIVTASPPFGGIGASLGLDILFLSWALNLVDFGRPTRGLIRGTVRRQAYQNGKLVSVAVTDVLPDSLSAVYTFYDPDAAARGLGSFAILSQLAQARRDGREHLYLGFWLAGHPKMDYKRSFRPLERLVGREWRPFAD